MFQEWNKEDAISRIIWGSYTTFHSTAIYIVNTLATAQSANRLKSELRKFLAPQILLID